MGSRSSAARAGTFVFAAAVGLALFSCAPADAQVTPLPSNDDNTSIAVALHEALGGDDSESPPRRAFGRELDERLGVIDRETARLAGVGDAAGAKRLETCVREIRARRAGDAPPDPVAAARANEPELHVVGVYAGGRGGGESARGGEDTVAVNVTCTDQPVVLALCAYDSVVWRVQLAEGVRVQLVVLGGYEDQQIFGLPTGVPVDEQTFRGGGAARYFYAYRDDDDRYAQTVARLKELTGLDVATFQGVYRPADGAQPFVVGPPNDEWATQRLLRDVEPAYLEAAAYGVAARRAAVRDRRFTAIHWTAAPGNAGRLEMAAALSEFNPAGPVAGTARPLPAGTRHAAVDPVDNSIYVLGRSDIVRIDAKTARATSITPDDPDLPDLSNPCGIAVDTKRRRVVVATLGGSGSLLAYAPQEGKWSVLADLHDLDLAGLTYAAEADCFYALPVSHADAVEPAVVRLSAADGKPEALIRPTRRIATGARPQRDDPGAQVVAAGSHVAILTSPAAPRDPNNRRRVIGEARQRCYLIDPRTGDVAYGGRVAAQPPDDGRVTDDALDGLWDALGRPADGTVDVDRTMAQLMAGGDGAVAFLRAELAPPPARVDAARVRELLAQLEGDDFRQRASATRELRRLGPAAALALRAARDAGPSPEALVRIEELLSATEPTPAHAARRQLALHVLSRIGTPDAIELLRELANDPADANRAEAAARAMRDFASE